MRVNQFTLAAGLALIVTASASAASFQSYLPVFDGPVADFEGFDRGTLISDQYTGITFSQVGGGRPQIDIFDWMFSYGSSSGSGVLTGSTEGGQPAPTVAGLIITFDNPQAVVQFFLSDTASNGNYPITAFDSTNTPIESFTLAGPDILPPGYSGGQLPPPGTFPAPGIYAGFVQPNRVIKSIQIGPSTADFDAFSIDDVLLPEPIEGQVPEPTTIALFGAGLSSLAILRKRLL